MKVLVTSATGFIGQYVVRELLHRGHAVIASASNAEKAIGCDWYTQVRFIPLDLRNVDEQANYYEYFDSPDAMIHLAWEGLPHYDSDFHEKDNLPRHEALLRNMIDGGLRSLTVTGTCLEYGLQEGKLSEDLLSMPTTSYARAKDALRISLEEWSKERGVSRKWVRLFYMYGKGQNPKSLLVQLEKALENGDSSFRMSGGQQERDFLPVEKVAGYITAIALQGDVTGVINCCSGKPITVEQFVREYLHRRGRSIDLELGYYPYPEHEPFRFWGDRGKLEQVLSKDERWKGEVR